MKMDIKEIEKIKYNNETIRTHIFVKDFCKDTLPEYLEQQITFFFSRLSIGSNIFTIDGIFTLTDNNVFKKDKKTYKCIDVYKAVKKTIDSNIPYFDL